MERTLLIQEMYDYVSPQSEHAFPMNSAMTGIVTYIQHQEEAILQLMRSELETEELYIQQEDGSRQNLAFEFLPEADIDLIREDPHLNYLIPVYVSRLVTFICFIDKPYKKQVSVSWCPG